MKFDLEERTEKFAKSVREIVKQLPNTIANHEDIKQLVRASGSVAANYIEANESLSKKDFVNRIKICRKESKESGLFLRLLDLGDSTVANKTCEELSGEAKQLVLIFNAILKKTGGAE